LPLNKRTYAWDVSAIRWMFLLRDLCMVKPY